jgi:hypothetical protein
MDNQLRNILDAMLLDEFRRSAGRQREMPTQVFTNEQTQLLTILRELIYGYNEQMRDFNNNVRTTLQLLQTIQTSISNLREPPIRVRQTTTNVPRTNAQPTRQNTNRHWEHNHDSNRFLSWLIYPITDLSGNVIPSTFNENVIVRPTQEQIQSATQFLEYDSATTSNTRCPITLEDFEEGEMVRRIIHCGHTFCETALQNWFRSNVRCPVCRYDIRTLSRPSNINQNENQNGYVSPIIIDTSNNIIDNTNTNALIQTITTSITNILQNYSDEQNIDMSMNILSR